MQRDVVAQSPEILNLGLLFGEDIDATTTDLPEVLSFQHKLIQEYLAAVYIADTLNQGTPCSFLEETFPTWNMVENHREVIQFACGILATTDASPLTYHVGKVLSDLIHKEINEGKCLPDESLGPRYSPPKNLKLFYALLKEGGAPMVHPHLTCYPECGRPLSEVLENTKLTVITDIYGKNDPLQLNASSVHIILQLKEYGEHRPAFDRLWQALHSTPASVTAIYLWGVKKSAQRFNMRHFSQLKHLEIEDASESELEELAAGIDSWGPHHSLTYCRLVEQFTIMPTPKSLVTALSKCVHLKSLDLGGHDLHDKLSILMASPAPGLRELELHNCKLQADDMNHVTEAFREGRLTRLEKLDIMKNPIGEAGVSSLLQAISTTSHAIKYLDVEWTGVDEAGKWIDLSEQFIIEWKGKLTNIHIDIKWE